MKAKELDYVRETIECEGFDYAFAHYTDFKEEVKDEEFHKLREQYLEARAKLAEYLNYDSD